MWARISQQYDFAYIDVPLIKYRIHLNNLGRNWTLQIRGQEAFFNKYKKTHKCAGQAEQRALF